MPKRLRLLLLLLRLLKLFVFFPLFPCFFFYDRSLEMLLGTNIQCFLLD